MVPGTNLSRRIGSLALARRTLVVALAFAVSGLTGCGESETPTTEGLSDMAGAIARESAVGIETDAGTKGEAVQITVTVNGVPFAATLADNMAASKLAEMLSGGPLTFGLSDYAGFEKVGDLGFSLPVENERITTAPGDIVLYQGDQIVCFYGENTWSYTRLARMDDLAGWEEALGSGAVELTLALP